MSQPDTSTTPCLAEAARGQLITSDAHSLSLFPDLNVTTYSGLGMSSLESSETSNICIVQCHSKCHTHDNNFLEISKTHFRGA